MPLLLLLVVLIVVPIAELYVILRVGDAIGVFWTILILVADSLLGWLLLRTQGAAVWRRFNAALAERRIPTREVLDGVLVIFGAAFLITPGFLTDVIGFGLLIPPSRALVRGVLARKLGKRMQIGVMPGRRGPRPPGSRSDYDVEGNATEYEAPPRRLLR